MLENIQKYITTIFGQELSGQSLVSVIVQIVFLVVLIFLVYQQIKKTQAERIITGILIASLLIACFYLFNLHILIKIFELLLPALLVGIIVLFAPELRKLLHKLGHSGLSFPHFLGGSGKTSNSSDKDISIMANNIVEAITKLSRNKHGGLIVLDNTWSDKLYLSTGCRLNALISAELLLNIFYPKSPLHDGAVIIRDQRIFAAAVILPITENPKLNPWQYGTRHRAALGITENNPSSFCLIVSEETGSISIAEKGSISKISNPEDIKALIQNKLRED